MLKLLLIALSTLIYCQNIPFVVPVLNPLEPFLPTEPTVTVSSEKPSTSSTISPSTVSPKPTDSPTNPEQPKPPQVPATYQNDKPAKDVKTPVTKQQADSNQSSTKTDDQVETSPEFSVTIVSKEIEDKSTDGMSGSLKVTLIIAIVCIFAAGVGIYAFRTYGLQASVEFKNRLKRPSSSSLGPASSFDKLNSPVIVQYANEYGGHNNQFPPTGFDIHPFHVDSVTGNGVSRSAYLYHESGPFHNPIDTDKTDADAFARNGGSPNEIGADPFERQYFQGNSLPYYSPQPSH